MAIVASPGKLASGYRAVPISLKDSAAFLRLCVVVSDTQDSGGWPFVLLNDLPDASVYLGCIADAGGNLHAWVEIWIQDAGKLAARFPQPEERFNNGLLDRQWVSRVQSHRLLDPEALLATGWEASHPQPLFLDAELRQPVRLGEAEAGGPWELCVDDAVLQSAGLPPYSTTLARCLHQPGLPDHGRFVQVAPGGAATGEAPPLSAIAGDLVPFNPGAGLMMVREFAPLGLEDWVDLLGGKAWRGVAYGSRAFRPSGVYRTLQDPSVIQSGGGHVFLARQGRAGRLLEALHLKLEVLGKVLAVTRDSIAQSQLPFLNLGPDSFRVRLSRFDSGLPFFWTATVALSAVAEAVSLPVETTESRYFLPAAFGASSIYRPATVSSILQSRGEIRIRKVLQKDGEFTVLECTLSTQERLAGSQDDLLSIHLKLPFGRVLLHGHFDPSSEHATGAEARFRTLPQKLDAAWVAALRQAEGVVFSGVAFEILPVLSSPCDLYAIGVLAVRALLVSEDLPLPVALDELLSASRKAGGGGSGSLHESLWAMAREDAHFRAALGPHRLSREGWTADEALSVVPERLWWSILAFVARLFAGLVSESFCRTLGDAPSLAIDKAFDAPVEELERLRLASRSMLLGDWKSDREIAALLSKITARQRTA